jgi:hypothetical protein
LVIVSCDAFRDTWLPFMLLWDKYGGSQKRRIFLITETAVFPERSDVTVIHPIAAQYDSSGDWIGMVRSGLQQIDTDYFFFTLDDFFLKAPIDWMKVEQYVPLAIRDNCDSLTLGLHDTTRRGNDIGIPGLFEVDAGSPYWLTTSPALWRKSSLLSILGARHGSAWEFEFTPREAVAFGVKQYMVDRGSFFFAPIWPYYAEFFTGFDAAPVLSDSAVAKGKWQKGIPGFLAYNGIHGIAFWKRGFHAYSPDLVLGGRFNKLAIRSRILWDLLVDVCIRPQLRGRAWATFTARFRRAIYGERIS